MALKIHNYTRHTVLADQGILADTFLTRFVGLMGRSSLPSREALIITRCQSIHMMFMKFPLDVIFLDRQKVVVGLEPNIRPGRFSRVYWKAYYAVEANPGAIEDSHTAIGDQVDWTPE